MPNRPLVRPQGVGQAPKSALVLREQSLTRLTLPNATYLFVVGCLAILIAVALPFSGWYGLMRNILISLIVAAIAIIGAMILGAALHSAIFFEPVQLE